MKTHRGITEMIKFSLAMVAMLFVMLYLILQPVSKDYWQNVGPQFDQLLNPNKYSNKE
jgi:hypothetical protein